MNIFRRKKSARSLSSPNNTKNDKNTSNSANRKVVSTTTTFIPAPSAPSATTAGLPPPSTPTSTSYQSPSAKLGPTPPQKQHSARSSQSRSRQSPNNNQSNNTNNNTSSNKSRGLGGRSQSPQKKKLFAPSSLSSAPDVASASSSSLRSLTAATAASTPRTTRQTAAARPLTAPSSSSRAVVPAPTTTITTTANPKTKPTTTSGTIRSMNSSSTMATVSTQPPSSVAVAAATPSTTKGTVVALPPTTTSAVQKRTSEWTNQSKIVPISKHYQLNQQILMAFESHYEAKLYQVAYAMGLQFVETALLELPKHGYYYSPRHERERMQSSLDAVRVTRLLQQIQTTSTSTNAAAAPFARTLWLEHDRVQKLAHLALEHVQQASHDQYEANRAQAEAELVSSEMSMEWVLLEPLLSCQDVLAQNLCGTGAVVAAADESAPTHKTASGQWGLPKVPALLSSNNNKTTAKAVTTDQHLLDSLPIAMAVPLETAGRQTSEPVRSSPPSSSLWRRPGGNNHNSTNDWNWVSHPTDTSEKPFSADDLLLEKALYLSGLQITPDTLLDDVQGDTSSWLFPPLANNKKPAQQPQPLPASSTSSSSSSSSGGGGSHPLSAAAHVAVGVPVAPDHTTATTKPSDLAKPTTGVADQPTATNIGSSRLEISMLSNLYREDFDHLRDMGRIQMTYAPTYQGRLPESTNGCTVIAPLMCIHHLLSNNKTTTYQQRTNSTRNLLVPQDDIFPDHLLKEFDNEEEEEEGLNDARIVHVIDQEAPHILRELRTQLGLPDQAFLIPADVHDFLIHNGHLHQDQFVTVVGGNILDDLHLHSLLQVLEECPQKLAATLYFHEHVVCILKVPRSNRTKSPLPSTRHRQEPVGFGDDVVYCYDLVDSLPLKETLNRSNNNGVLSAFSSLINGNHNSGSSSGDWTDDGNDVILHKTARFRCLDLEALQGCLKWYACSKFTPANVRYIDSYEWPQNATAVDFDPRVFQATVWRAAPTR